MTWNEGEHRRDARGRFTHATVGAWAKDVAKRLNERGLKRGDERPPGFDAAVERSQYLWSVPDRRRGIQRTDEQQAELEDLERAFELYREQLGATERDPYANKLQFQDAAGRKFDEYGRHLGGGLPLTGPGRQKGKPREAKEAAWSRKHEDMTSTPLDRERRAPEDGGKIGRRAAQSGTASEFMTYLKRAQARARSENARHGTRRTPRGTTVDTWMSTASERMGARRGA